MSNREGKLERFPAPGRRSLRLALAASRIRADYSFAVLDIVLVGCAYLGVLVLRFDGSVPPEWWGAFRPFVPVAIVVHFLCNWTFGLYGQIWRHAGIHDARKLLLAGGTAGAVLSFGYLLLDRRLPASVVVLGSLLATVLLGGLRFQSRLFAFQRPRSPGDPLDVDERYVVIGAGQAAVSIIKEMQEAPALGMRPVAILDDDPRKHGRWMHGVPIIGGLERFPVAVDRFGANHALLAVPSADREMIQHVANAADAVHLTLKVLPSVTELLGGEVSARDARDLSITDLLGRQQVTTDLAAVRAVLHDKTVLITGAGGSIGSELARQVAVCGPARLLLLDHDETHLHDAAARIPEPSVQVLADITDPEGLERVFATYEPDVVFHAAAHKHVPLLEQYPCAAAKTNVLGTDNVIAVAARHDVERLVFVSTDKAVRPTSVMGASKRIGEALVVMSTPPGAAWCAVRFGNVLGSRGSVIPTFIQQIQHGGPVTVTDARMTRFFMSIEEAVQLILQAAAFASGGEIYMLDMGEPVRIIDLAERMIRLSGRRPGQDVAIQVVGARPGEKLVEELRSPLEQPRPTPHESIVQLFPELPPPAQVRASVRQLADAVRRGDDGAARAMLFRLSAPGTHDMISAPPES